MLLYLCCSLHFIENNFNNIGLLSPSLGFFLPILGLSHWHFYRLLLSRFFLSFLRLFVFLDLFILALAIDLLHFRLDFLNLHIIIEFPLGKNIPKKFLLFLVLLLDGHLDVCQLFFCLSIVSIIFEQTFEIFLSK